MNSVNNGEGLSRDVVVVSPTPRNRAGGIALTPTHAIDRLRAQPRRGLARATSAQTAGTAEDASPALTRISLRTLPEARVVLRTRTLTERYEERRRIIEQEPDPIRRSLLAFFYDLDIETDPGMLGNLGLPSDQLEARRQAIIGLRPLLKDYALARAALARHRTPLPPLPQDSATKAQIKLISDLLFRIAQKSFAGTEPFDLDRFRAAFDLFALGKLYCGPAPADGAPDSAHFTSFAVFAEWASVIPGPHQADWANVLHVFVATSAQYLVAYRPAAPAYNLYTIRKPLPLPEITPSHWTEWKDKDRNTLLTEFGAMMAVAFAKNLA